MTFEEAVAEATRRFEQAGIDSARLDAEVLVCDAAGIARSDLFAHGDRHLDAGAARLLEAAVARREAREPLAYIRGRKSFRFLELMSDARALVPRPETELLVELAHEVGPARVLDIGSGSGAVALAIASELAECEVVGTDTSAPALELARENKIRLGLADRVVFLEGTVPDEGVFDLAVANLPYIEASAWDLLPPEVRLYEPREALVGGVDGLDVVREVAHAMAGRARVIAFEIGEGQAQATAEIVSAAGWGHVRGRRDLAGIERVVIGEASSEEASSGAGTSDVAGQWR